MLGRIGLLGLALCCPPVLAEDSALSPHWDFVVGRYHLIGRMPDSHQTYTGVAHIERVGERLRLWRKIGKKTSEVFGEIRRADPGEAPVMAVAWGGRTAYEMVCVIGSDLDNYARLTCRWGLAGNPHRLAGMEAYFAQAPWDTTP